MKYVLGEVNSKLYWHEVDETKTEQFRSTHPSEIRSWSVTTHDLKFKSRPVTALPKNTRYPMYTGQ